MNKEELKRLIVTKPNSLRAKAYRQICDHFNSILDENRKLVFNNDFSVDITTTEFNARLHLDDIFETFSGYRMTGKYLLDNVDFQRFMDDCTDLFNAIYKAFIVFQESSIVMFDVKGDFPENDFSGFEHLYGNIWSFTESITIDPQNVNECRFDEIRVNNVRMNPEQPVTFTFGEDYNVTGIVQNASSGAYVNLGLPSGTKWATCNIGASSPQEAGNYFAWGEIKEREYPYDPETYKLAGADLLHGSQIFKALNGYDGLKELDIDHDAAYITRGSHWRTPSEGQVKELLSNTTPDYGESGVTLVSNINGESIFLPYAGSKQGKGINASNMYMTRSFLKAEVGVWNILNVSTLDIDGQEPSVGHDLRGHGLPIRPVYVDNPDCVEYDGEWIENFADFHLPSGTLWNRRLLNNSANYYFAWAETAERQNKNESFGWENYYYYDGENFSDDYYNENKEEYTEGNPGYNITDKNNLIHLRDFDDPARASNVKTSMPTLDQWKELAEHTTIEYDGSLLFIYNEFDNININVKKGVFYDELSNGMFWTNELAMGDSDFNAVSISFANNGHISIESDSRCSGLNVLPVARKYFDNDENE